MKYAFNMRTFFVLSMFGITMCGPSGLYCQNPSLNCTIPAMCTSGGGNPYNYTNGDWNYWFMAVCGLANNPEGRNIAQGTVYVIDKPNNNISDAQKRAILFTATSGTNAPGIIKAGGWAAVGFNPNDPTFSSNTTCTLPDGAEVDFRADEEIFLYDGFHAQVGSQFHAYIKPDWETVWERRPGVYRDGNNNLDVAALSREWRFLRTGDPAANPAQYLNLTASTDPDQQDFPYILHINNTNSNGAPCNANVELFSRKTFTTNHEIYGRYEVYAKVDDPGLNRAVGFTLYTGADPSHLEEFDVLERAGATECQYFYDQRYYNDYINDNIRTHTPAMVFNDSFSPIDVHGWHWYSCEILPEEIRFLMDGYVMYRSPNGQRGAYNAILHTHKEPFLMILGTGSCVEAGKPDAAQNLLIKSVRLLDF